MKWIDIAKESSESTIKRVLGREPELLLEMAMPLKVFIDRMDGLKMEMVVHWCLCEYCHLFDKGNLTSKHWRGELANFINTFRDFKIKGKVNKKKTLQKQVRYGGVDGQGQEDGCGRIVRILNRLPD